MSSNVDHTDTERSENLIGILNCVYQQILYNRLRIFSIHENAILEIEWSF